MAAELDPEGSSPNHHNASTTSHPNPEEQPLLQPARRETNEEEEEENWRPPRGFTWIQLALMSNVFLHAFDSTITVATYAVISSEFDAANSASWLTTAYLVTSTATQPLYGRISDIFGRRWCFFVSTVLFALGCLGCGLARGMVTLICMRALSGLGGGGLLTMSTIINSDMIPFRRRGMYQAMQNGCWGLGAISGASIGGAIADKIGWRWCFLLQLPFSLSALTIGILAVRNQPGGGVIASSLEAGLGAVWKRIDFSGAVVLVMGVSVQLVGLSMGGNELPWSSPWVLGALVTSFVLMGVFLVIESRTTAIPMIPLRMLKGRLPIATQIANISAGFAAFGFIFILPLYFQVVLLDSPSKAGARLAIPSLATPTGSLIAGITMSRWGKLLPLVRVGTTLMVLGNALVASLRFRDDAWKYIVYMFPANMGQGITYPSILFTTIASHEHADHAVSVSTVYLLRSLGTVWGVAITSSIVQNTLSARLPDALGDIPDKWRIVNDIRHSLDALWKLPPDLQLQARLVYYQGLRHGFMASTAAAVIAVIASLCASATNLRRTH